MNCVVLPPCSGKLPELKVAVLCSPKSLELFWGQLLPLTLGDEIMGENSAIITVIYTVSGFVIAAVSGLDAAFRLRMARDGRTQQDLADRCSVTRQTIIALESGRYSPSLELAFRLAREFGVGVEAVFKWQPRNR